MRSNPWIRPIVVIAVVAAWFGLTSVGGAYFGKLSSQQSYDSASFLPKSAESTLEAAQRATFTTVNDIPAIVLLNGVKSPDQVAALKSALTAAYARTLPNGKTVGELVDGAPIIVPSADGTAVVAIVNLPFAQAFAQDGSSFVGIEIVDAIRAAWKDSGSTGEVYVTGPLGIFADSFAAFSGIDGILLLVAGIVVLLILLIVYRSPVLPLFVLLTAGTALSVAGLAVYALARSGALSFNGQSQGIMSILVVGATTDYSLLLVSRYREELRRVESPYAAMKQAWRRSLAPIAASAITVILCLLTLLVSNLASNQSLGPVSAIGIAFALIASLTFLPALLLIGGARARWVFWPGRPKFHPEDVDHVDTLAAIEQHAGIWGRVSRAVATRPRRTWVVAAVGLAIAASFLPTFKAGGVGDDQQFLNQTESRTGLAIYSQHFPAGQTSPIQITAAAGSADAVVAAVKEIDGIASVTPLTPSLLAGKAPTGPETPVVVGGRVAINAVSQVNSSSQAATDLVKVVRAAVQKADPTALVGGSAATNLDTNTTTNRDLSVIVPLVLLVILIVLTILLRALVAPLIIVAANVLSFAATLGVAAIVFNHVLHYPGSNTAVPLFGFVFLVALGVDYSIFLMSRAREEALVRGTREGIRRSLAVTGGVITSAGVVLAATFGSLAVLPILFLVQIAFIVAFGVLLDTLVVRTLLIPGVIYDLGNRAWWPWHSKLPADDPVENAPEVIAS
jgi:RND superfamily putative drug exporter